MSVEKVTRATGEVVWRVRWRQHGRNRARTFSTRRDARDFDAEVRRQRRAGSLAALDAGTETLGEYVTGAWVATHAPVLAPKTRLHYAGIYDHHLRPYLGSIALREITPELIGRWQSDRLASGAGPTAVRHAINLLGSILEHAFAGGRLPENPVRRVKKARGPRREEVQALPPAKIEAMRSALGMRDATLISVLAYAGLRPGEALGLRWGDIRERTLLIQRSISLGSEADTKTRQHRTARLAPLASDLLIWRMALARTTTNSYFPAGPVSPGPRPPTNRGGGGRLRARSTRLTWHMCAHMTCVIALPRYCCTRVGASSTWHASSATTHASR